VIGFEYGMPWRLSNESIQTGLWRYIEEWPDNRHTSEVSFQDRSSAFRRKLKNSYELRFSPARERDLAGLARVSHPGDSSVRRNKPALAIFFNQRDGSRIRLPGLSASHRQQVSMWNADASAKQNGD
jgi:hypothetical protein